VVPPPPHLVCNVSVPTPAYLTQVTPYLDGTQDGKVAFVVSHRTIDLTSSPILSSPTPATIGDTIDEDILLATDPGEQLTSPMSTQTLLSDTVDLLAHLDQSS
jgi:hypothetical protein